MPIAKGIKSRYTTQVNEGSGVGNEGLKWNSPAVSGFGFPAKAQETANKRNGRKRETISCMLTIMEVFRNAQSENVQ